MKFKCSVLRPQCKNKTAAAQRLGWARRARTRSPAPDSRPHAGPRQGLGLSGATQTLGVSSDSDVSSTSLVPGPSIVGHTCDSECWKVCAWGRGGGCTRAEGGPRRPLPGQGPCFSPVGPEGLRVACALRLTGPSLRQRKGVGSRNLLQLFLYTQPHQGPWEGLGQGNCVCP